MAIKKTLLMVYKDARKGWRWRWRLTDVHSRRLIGASTESYKRRRDCISNLLRVSNAGRSVDATNQLPRRGEFRHFVLS